MKLVKTSLHIQLKQTKPENQLYISTECPKKGFNEVSQHFVDELKQCNLHRRMDLEPLVSVFLCLYSTYLVAMLSFRKIVFHNLFCIILFLVNVQYLSPMLQDLFLIFNENLLQ